LVPSFASQVAQIAEALRQAVEDGAGGQPATVEEVHVTCRLAIAAGVDPSRIDAVLPAAGETLGDLAQLAQEALEVTRGRAS
jgi:hypothetical protein